MSKTFSGVPGDSRCECSDTKCAADHGQEGNYCSNTATQILYRIDMLDETGTAFCEGCAEDAFSSGLFTDISIDEQLNIEDQELEA